MDIASHVSRQMLKHNSHIRMKAQRDALNAIGENHKDSQGCAEGSRGEKRRIRPRTRLKESLLHPDVYARAGRKPFDRSET